MIGEDKKPRAIMPAQIAPLVQWGKLEGCIILCLGSNKESNHVVMSSLTFNEITLLHAQLGAHINTMLANSLVEGLPYEGLENAK